MKGTNHISRVASDFLYIGEYMEEYYVVLQYSEDDDMRGIGILATAEQIAILRD